MDVLFVIKDHGSDINKSDIPFLSALLDLIKQYHGNASVNSSSAHPPRANPRALAFFLKWQIPGGGDKKVRQMPPVGTKKEGKCPTPGFI